MLIAMLQEQHDRQIVMMIATNKANMDAMILGWEFQFLVLISGTPIVSGILIPCSIPKILVGTFF